VFTDSIYTKLSVKHRKNGFTVIILSVNREKSLLADSFLLSFYFKAQNPNFEAKILSVFLPYHMNTDSL